VSGAATTVNLRRGSLSGAIVWSFSLTAAGSLNFSWHAPIYVQEGVFVECTTAVTAGSIDLN
jgi:hypothetical protein